MYEDILKCGNIDVEYINSMGTDLSVVNAARVSYNKESLKLNDKDKGLLKFLAENNHMSPFEHCVLSVRINCPLFVRSQIHRHRTFSYNEISRRYTSKNIEFYFPMYINNQHNKDKQMSSSEKVQDSDELKDIMRKATAESFLMYEHLLECGVSREQARMILPQNLMTTFYMTGNLRNWVQFMYARIDIHAQYEVRAVAYQVKNILFDKFPVCMSVLYEEGDG